MDTPSARTTPGPRLPVTHGPTLEGTRADALPAPAPSREGACLPEAPLLVAPRAARTSLSMDQTAERSGPRKRYQTVLENSIWLRAEQNTTELQRLLPALYPGSHLKDLCDLAKLISIFLLLQAACPDLSGRWVFLLQHSARALPWRHRSK